MTSVITACNLLKADDNTGSHLIFRNTAKLVFAWEEIKEAGDWLATVHQNMSAAWCHHIKTLFAFITQVKRPKLRNIWNLREYLWALKMLGTRSLKREAVMNRAIKLMKKNMRRASLCCTGSIHIISLKLHWNIIITTTLVSSRERVSTRGI